MAKTITADLSRECDQKKRLVESNGYLYLVTNSDDYNRTFKAYKLIEDLARWTEVSNLEDKAFFIGFDFSFSFPAPVHARFDWDCAFAIHKTIKRYKLVTGEEDTSISWDLPSPLPYGSGFSETHQESRYEDGKTPGMHSFPNLETPTVK